MKDVVMSPRYQATLTKEERKELDAMTYQGKTGARRFIHRSVAISCLHKFRHDMLLMLQQRWI